MQIGSILYPSWKNRNHFEIDRISNADPTSKTNEFQILQILSISKWFLFFQEGYKMLPICIISLIIQIGSILYPSWKNRNHCEIDIISNADPTSKTNEFQILQILSISKWFLFFQEGYKMLPICIISLIMQIGSILYPSWKNRNHFEIDRISNADPTSKTNEFQILQILAISKWFLFFQEGYKMLPICIISLIMQIGSILYPSWKNRNHFEIDRISNADPTSKTNEFQILQILLISKLFLFFQEGYKMLPICIISLIMQIGSILYPFWKNRNHFEIDRISNADPTSKTNKFQILQILSISKWFLFFQEGYKMLPICIISLIMQIGSILYPFWKNRNHFEIDRISNADPTSKTNKFQILQILSISKWFLFFQEGYKMLPICIISLIMQIGSILYPSWKNRNHFEIDRISNADPTSKTNEFQILQILSISKCFLFFQEGYKMLPICIISLIIQIGSILYPSWKNRNHFEIDRIWNADPTSKTNEFQMLQILSISKWFLFFHEGYKMLPICIIY